MHGKFSILGLLRCVNRGEESLGGSFQVPRQLPGKRFQFGLAIGLDYSSLNGSWKMAEQYRVYWGVAFWRHAYYNNFTQ